MIPLLLKTSRVRSQSDTDTSFIGGKPRIPQTVSIPHCDFCGSLLTFYFQVAFPDSHVWKNRSLALFSCTSCARTGYEIPQIFTPQPPASMKGVDLPSGFLEDSQKNFRSIVFDTDNAEIRANYQERISFKKWQLTPTENPRVQDSFIADTPIWKGKDETPGTYGREPLIFLGQIRGNMVFEILEDAPLQAKRSIHPSLPPYRSERNYILFVQNVLYLFGNAQQRESVYILCQRP